MFASLVISVLNRYIPLRGELVKEIETPNIEQTEHSFSSTEQEELVMPTKKTVETQQSLTTPLQAWEPINQEVHADNMTHLKDKIAYLHKGFADAPVNAWYTVTHRCFPFQKWVPRYKDNGCELKYLHRALKEDLNELFTFRYTHPDGIKQGANARANVRKEYISTKQLDLNMQMQQIQENTAYRNEANFNPEEFFGAEFDPEYQKWYQEQILVQHANTEDDVDWDQHLLLWRQQQENDAAKVTEAVRVKSIAGKKASLLEEMKDIKSSLNTLLKRREGLQERIYKLRIEGYSLDGKLKTMLAKSDGTDKLKKKDSKP